MVKSWSSCQDSDSHVQLKKRMERGYENSSPLLAFILAIITKIRFNIPRATSKKIPISIIIRNADMIRYIVIEIWKFRDSLPCWSTHGNSSFLIAQIIRGPIILPKGKMNPARAARWQSIPKVRSSLLNCLISTIFMNLVWSFFRFTKSIFYRSLLKSRSSNPSGLFGDNVWWSKK